MKHDLKAQIDLVWKKVAAEPKPVVPNLPTRSPDDPNPKVRQKLIEYKKILGLAHENVDVLEKLLPLIKDDRERKYREDNSLRSAKDRVKLYKQFVDLLPQFKLFEDKSIETELDDINPNLAELYTTANPTTLRTNLRVEIQMNKQRIVDITLGRSD